MNFLAECDASNLASSQRKHVKACTLPGQFPELAHQYRAEEHAAAPEEVVGTGDGALQGVGGGLV